MIANVARRLTLAAAGVGLLAAAGCSSVGSKSPGSTQAAAGSGGTTVAIANSDKGQILTDADGRALYGADQEASGKVACTSSACTAIWQPLTVANGQRPTGPSQLAGKLATITRPDGKAQVTLDGRPLYTFSFDHSAGAVGGDGKQDSFGAASFTWRSATPTGFSSASTASSSAPSSSSGGGGGYGY